MTWRVLKGDCIEVMAEMEEASVDAVVCDPPYGLSREPNIADVLTHWLAGDDYEHRGGGFMGQTWDSFVPGPSVWRECLRVLKPGGHLLAFAGSRTADLMGISIRTAGFEIRDSIMFLYGAGFPKSHDVSKAIDKAAGAEREIVAESRWGDRDSDRMLGQVNDDGREPGGSAVTAPATEAAKTWDGWGTALKPAHEPIVVARKPFAGTVAANVLEHGTGAINIDACRIGMDTQRGERYRGSAPGGGDGSILAGPKQAEAWDAPAGRWPANAVFSHLETCEQVGTTVVKGDQRDTGAGKRPGGFADVGAAAGDREPNAEVYGPEAVPIWECAPGCPVAELDAQSGVLTSGFMAAGTKREGIGYQGLLGNRVRNDTHGDSGGASRFFYCAKTSRAERNAGLEGFEERMSQKWNEGGIKARRAVEGKGMAANHHPTVKPINLMRWLVRLVTPPGGLILDPFLGSGSTGCAAVLEGFNFTGIEREPEYIAIAEARIRFWAQHEGREVEDVLGLVARSQRESKAHADQGQSTIDDFLSEAAA